MIVYAGVQNTSFATGRADLLNLARLDIAEKQVERLTERIGRERVDQRDGQVQAFLELPLMEKFAAEAAHAPDLAVVSMDGGRLQIRGQTAGSTTEESSAGHDAASGPPTAPSGASVPEGGELAGSPAGERSAGTTTTANEARAGHWREDKVGLLMTMTSEESAVDPCPTIPKAFVDPLRILKLTRELRKGCPAGEDAVADLDESDEGGLPECRSYAPPKVKVKSMVATRRGVDQFGPILAAAARARGFYRARRKAFVSDGSEANRGVQRRWFSDFVAILDFIHALSYVFAAAMAGRGFAAGWEVYVQWISLVWQGRVTEVIDALRRRQEELGAPATDESEGSPRRVVADALRYLENHRGQMQYDEYRRQGLPITSSHVESTVKQFNRRVKGTEKFWSERGAEAVLQLRADYLSETEPTERFWKEREDGATGRKCYRRVV
jgi:hypothetical protein